MPDMTWTEAGRQQPPPGRLVVVRVPGRDTPMIGWYHGMMPGPPPGNYPRHCWIVPGFGGNPSLWCDCLPPLIDPPPPEKSTPHHPPMGP